MSKTRWPRVHRDVSSYDREAPVPEVGSLWDWYNGETARPLGVPAEGWEPQSIFERVRVAEVKWNGEEWWVRTDGPTYGLRWNDISIFWENVKPI